MHLRPVGASYLGPGVDRPEDVSALAKYIFERYDKDRGGILGSGEVVAILADTYRSINKTFTPKKDDIEYFSKVLDMNKDGKIDVRDVEMAINKFLKVGVEVVKVGSSYKRQSFSTGAGS